MELSAQSFYDQLAASYHLIYADWEASVRRQGELLDALIRAELARQRDTEPEKPVTVLDCSCGIGTQAIGLARIRNSGAEGASSGLALRSYTVLATDISPEAVERAGREAARLGVPLTTGVADFRSLPAKVEGQFDVVLTFDNALPHLLDDADLRLAARGIAAKTAPGGVFLASIRDYDRLRDERPTFDGPRLLAGKQDTQTSSTSSGLDGPDGRRIVFQMWDWDADGAAYTVNQFILREVDPAARVDPEARVDPAARVDRKWISAHYQTRYRALRRAELEGFLAEAGFDSIRWDMTGFHQPLLIARRTDAPS